MRIRNHFFKGLKIDVVTSYMNAFQQGWKHKIGFCNLLYMKAFEEGLNSPLITAFLAFPRISLTRQFQRLFWYFGY